MSTKLSGPQKAATFMLAVGEEHASKLFAMMHEDEIRDISQAMASLGTVSASAVEDLAREFSETIGQTGHLVGSWETTERMLLRTLPRERVSQIMEEIRGPAGRTMWDKLGNVNEAVLANYLKNEYPHAHEMMAEIFNNLDRQSETRILAALEERNRDAAERIRSLMFTFDDLVRVDGQGVQVLVRSVPKEQLLLALKGASENLRDLFFKNMSERAGKMFKEDLANLGPVRLRDVDEAQAAVVMMAKDLAAQGQITLQEGREDEMVY